MKKQTRILSLLLAVCLAVSLLTLPAGAVAAAKTFSDISDRDTAVAVESLRLMGVLDGYTDGTFRPDGSLTRAQFCKMAVYATDASSELGQYKTVTVFPDVRPSYWAAGFVNLAAKGKHIIAGYPNGQFQPERKVTTGQAVTILMRLLGYADTDVGGIWPQGYLSAASTAGLTDGISVGSGSEVLTRGQAAKLFLNLLRCDTKDGKDYAGTIATVVDDVMLVSSTALSANGTNTAMQSGAGQTYQMANKTSNGSLNGQRGMLLLNKGGKVLTFVPYSTGSTVTVTVSSATSTQLTDTAGKKYALDGDTMVYRNSGEEKWSAAYSWLTSGTTVTLYLNSAGSVDYVFVGGGSTASTAVVVAAKGSTAGLTALAGDSTDYALYKDGVKADAGDLRQYDVATYSSATNTIRVCDTRITGNYEAAYPNLTAPEKVTLLGHEFPVLASACESLSKFKLGDQVTILLTEDNQVAGAVAATGTVGASGNALGIVQSVSTTSATVNLLCGISITGTVSLSDSAAGQLKGQLVKVSSGSRGVLSLSRVTGGTSGDLDVSKKTLGFKSLRDNVVVYQQTSDGLTATSLSQLTSNTIPESAVACTVTDWAGRISILVLGDEAGSTSIYGLAKITSETTTVEATEDTPEKTYTTKYLTLYSGGKTYGPIACGYNITNNTFIGITLNSDGQRVINWKSLTKISKVANSAWISESAVTVGAKTYSVPSTVLCYNRASESWVSLSEAHGFSGVCNLYVDSSNIVRIVEVGQ